MLISFLSKKILFDFKIYENTTNKYSTVSYSINPEVMPVVFYPRVWDQNHLMLKNAQAARFDYS